MRKNYRRRQNDERLGLTPLRHLECAAKLLSPTKRKRFRLDLHGMSHAFHRAELKTRDLSIPHDRYALEPGNGLDQKLYLLRTELRNVEEQAGHVAARLRQRFDPTGSDGIGLQINSDNGNRGRCPYGRTKDVRLRGKQDIDPRREQLIDEDRYAFETLFGETVLDDHVLSEHIT